jgi:hypothetical protein
MSHARLRHSPVIEQGAGRSVPSPAACLRRRTSENLPSLIGDARNATLERFPVDMGQNTSACAAGVAARWIALLLRHPGAARPRRGRAGPGRDPCTSRQALAWSFAWPDPRSPRTYRPIREQAERAWVPAWSRSGLSGPRGAGMTLVEASRKAHRVRHSSHPPDRRDPNEVENALAVRWRCREACLAGIGEGAR